MLLSSRTIFLFRARRYDQISKGLNSPNSLIEKCTGNKDWVARSTLGCDSVTNTLRIKLLSFNYQATELLGVLISHIMVHLSAFWLRQHGTEEWKMMARSITASGIHKSWCNSHDTLDIKMVTLPGRTEQKLDWHFDPRNTTTLTQS